MPTFKNFKDKRDGKVYKCVLMPDNRWWSAENLRWDGGEKRAPGNNVTNVATHGWLYLDTLAKGYCPEGSHLPSTYDWNLAGLTYADFVSKTVNGGRDTYGLNILMAGYSGNAFGTSAEFSGIYNDWVYFNSSAQSVAIGPGSGDYVSVRFIVDTFPPEFDPTTITSISNLQFQTGNRQFRGETGNYRTLGYQGMPILKGTVTWDLATSQEESDFDEWFDIETPWEYDQFTNPGIHNGFPGLGPVTMQAVSNPKKTRTAKGLSVSLDVVIFPDTQTLATATVPVMTPYAGVEAGYGFADEQLVVATSGRVTAREVTGKRGETFSVSWNTTLAGSLGFLAWYSAFSRRQFLGSLCGKTAWLWKIVGAPSMAITGEMVRISMVINGRDVNRALAVTITKEW